MTLRKIQSSTIALLLVVGILVFVNHSRAQKRAHSFVPVIPRVWDDDEMASLHVPLADQTTVPKQVSADYYYNIPERPIYKSYPVYSLDQEPAGYFEKLKQLEPEIAFDSSQFKTEADWTRAGAVVFEAAVNYDTVVTAAQVRNPQWYKQLAVPATKDGVLPWFRYVVREKGKVELGTLACAMCHTRVTPGGTVVNGAQGISPLNRRRFSMLRSECRLRCCDVLSGHFLAYPG
jgi:hypothetical protein